MELKDLREKPSDQAASQMWELTKTYFDSCKREETENSLRVDFRHNAFVAWSFKTLMEQGWEPKVNKVDDRVLDYIDRTIPQGSDAEAALPVGQFADDVLQQAILMHWDGTGVRGVRHEDLTYTKPDVARLAARALHIRSDDTVADLCCGVGTFMVEAFKGTDARVFHGTDYSYEALMVALMRASVIDAPIEVRLGNVFDMDGTFDKVFVDAPWGVRLRNESQLYTESMEGHIKSAATKRVTSEWFFALKALDCLNEGGRAAVTMPMGALSGSASAPLRRQLVQSGSVIAVIALPKGLMPGTGVPSNLLVLGSPEEGRLMTFVDASDLGGGRQNVGMGTDAIDEAIRRLDDPEDAHTAVATAAEIADEGWSLVPVRYVDRIDLDDVVTLGSLATNITRGIGQIKLDKRVVEEDSPYRYLETRSLDEDGNVAHLTYIDRIKSREERYCVQDGDIVLGKSSPFRTAVVHTKPEERVLCSGNFYIIRPDRSKVDPVYLKLFLDSQLGQSQLRRISTGAVVLTIPIKDLKDLQVPLVPMEEQHEIAEHYANLTNEIALYRRRIERTRGKIDELFPMGGQS